MLSFMNQLSMQGSAENTISESEKTDKKKKSSAANLGIKLHLVDRTKANVEGSALKFIARRLILSVD